MSDEAEVAPELNPDDGPPPDAEIETVEEEEQEAAPPPLRKIHRCKTCKRTWPGDGARQVAHDRRDGSVRFDTGVMCPYCLYGWYQQKFGGNKVYVIGEEKPPEPEQPS